MCNFLVKPTATPAVVVALFALAGAAPAHAAVSSGAGHVHSLHCGHGLLEWGGTGAPPRIDAGAVPNDGPSQFRFFGGSSSRWGFNSNAAGFTGRRGDGITLTYGVVPDGTNISGGIGEPAGPSDLVSFLNSTVGSEAVWQGLIDQAYQRWGALSGLTIVREDNDDGNAVGGISGGGPRGQTGVRADLRIGGHFIDGQSGSNTLAYNYSPQNGDHVVDTSNTFFYGLPDDNFRAFRNVFAHEAGHALGLAHLESSNGNFLMEPFINTSFDGPQLDDVLAIQRNYGDRFESGAGNDSVSTATALGSLVPVAITEPVSALAIGTDANDGTTSVGIDDVDFVSIDGVDDQDVFAFTLAAAGEVTLQLDPRGSTYDEGPQGGTQSAFNTKLLSDLALDLLDSSGALLGTSDFAGAGFGEIITQLLDAGDYYVAVRAEAGADDNVQLYELNVSALVIPEPGSAALLLGLSGVLGARGRRGA